jgi:hypothetical protein
VAKGGGGEADGASKPVSDSRVGTANDSAIYGSSSSSGGGGGNSGGIGGGGGGGKGADAAPPPASVDLFDQCCSQDTEKDRNERLDAREQALRTIVAKFKQHKAAQQVTKAKKGGKTAAADGQISKKKKKKKKAKTLK